MLLRRLSETTTKSERGVLLRRNPLGTKNYLSAQTKDGVHCSIVQKYSSPAVDAAIKSLGIIF